MVSLDHWNMITLFYLVGLLLNVHVVIANFEHSVKVFHFMVSHWGESRFGLQHCDNIACDWTHADKVYALKDNLMETDLYKYGKQTTTLSLYNIHSWWEKTRDTKPNICELNTNLTMAESEESKVRYHQLFDQSFKNFDGFSTTHTASNLQRVYIESNFSAEELHAVKNFSTLIKAASYVASDCHKRDSANANRDGVVHQIRLEGFRVDGLGRCMHSIGPEGISLSKSRDTRYNLHMKRDVIGHFLFNLAFENSLEPGYVTEKPFDAMMGGTVPVYLGDAEHLRSLLPHPKAAIFVSDFANISSLVAYLQHLAQNESAYEEHRAWRFNYSVAANIVNRPLLSDSWFCRVCKWAVNQTAAQTSRASRPSCELNATVEVPLKAESVRVPVNLEGKAVRGSSRQEYLVRGGALHAIPDLQTFTALKLDLEHIVVLDDGDMHKYVYGEPLPRAS